MRIIEHFGLAVYFDKVFGSELDGTRSNKTELLRYAIDRNDHANRRIMVGDRKHDLIGAVDNDIAPIGVSYGFGSVSELNDAGAVAIADAPHELPVLIRRVVSMLD